MGAFTRKKALASFQLEFKILQLIQYIVETDNNDIRVCDVVIQMQIVVFGIGDPS